MATITLDLSQFKAAGVYTVEFDISESITIDTNTIRLVVGFSKKGPFNTPVFLRNVKDARRIFGDIDSNLENRGSYFHRAMFTCLEVGPILALNLLSLNNAPISEGGDSAQYISYSLDTAEINSLPQTELYGSYFNQERFWRPDDDNLRAIVDNNTVTAGKLLNFVNLSKSKVSMIIRKEPNVTGFNVTAREFYSSNASEKPDFINEFDFMSDYFVTVSIIEGRWDNFTQLSSDPEYSLYFNEKGIIKNQINNFLNRPEVINIANFTGAIIPDLIDNNNANYSIDTIINNAYQTTNIFVELNREALDNFDISTSKVDLVGHNLIDSTVNQINFLGYNTAINEAFTYNESTDYTGTIYNQNIASPFTIQNSYIGGNSGVFQNVIVIPQPSESDTTFTLDMYNTIRQSLIIGQSLVKSDDLSKPLKVVAFEEEIGSPNLLKITVEHPDKGLEPITNQITISSIDALNNEVCFVGDYSADPNLVSGNTFLIRDGVNTYYFVVDTVVVQAGTSIEVTNGTQFSNFSGISQTIEYGFDSENVVITDVDSGTSTISISGDQSADPNLAIGETIFVNELPSSNIIPLKISNTVAAFGATNHTFNDQSGSNADFASDGVDDTYSANYGLASENVVITNVNNGNNTLTVSGNFASTPNLNIGDYIEVDVNGNGTLYRTYKLQSIVDTGANTNFTLVNFDDTIPNLISDGISAGTTTIDFVYSGTTATIDGSVAIDRINISTDVTSNFPSGQFVYIESDSVGSPGVRDAYLISSSTYTVGTDTTEIIVTLPDGSASDLINDGVTTGDNVVVDFTQINIAVTGNATGAKIIQLQGDLTSDLNLTSSPFIYISENVSSTIIPYRIDDISLNGSNTDIEVLNADGTTADLDADNIDVTDTAGYGLQTNADILSIAADVATFDGNSVNDLTISQPVFFINQTNTDAVVYIYSGPSSAVNPITNITLTDQAGNTIDLNALGINTSSGDTISYGLGSVGNQTITTINQTSNTITVSPDVSSVTELAVGQPLYVRDTDLNNTYYIFQNITSNVFDPTGTTCVTVTDGTDLVNITAPLSNWTSEWGYTLTPDLTGGSIEFYYRPDRFIIDRSSSPNKFVGSWFSQPYLDFRNNITVSGDRIYAVSLSDTQYYLKYNETVDENNINIIEIEVFVDDLLTVYAPDVEIRFGNKDRENTNVSATELIIYSLSGNNNGNLNENITIVPNSLNTQRTKFRINAIDNNRLEVGYFAVGLYTDADDNTTNRLTRIINKRRVLNDMQQVEYEIETVLPVRILSNQITRFLPIDTFATEYNVQPLNGFNLTSYHLPDGSESQIEKIYGVLSPQNSNISKVLADNDVTQFRYIIDTMDGGLASNMGGKVYLSELAKRKQFALALLNIPSIRKFLASNDPIFTDEPDPANGIPNPTLNTLYIAQGGNLSLGPSFRFTLPTEEQGSKYLTTLSPFLVIRENNRNKIVPPAADISNNMVRRFINGEPYSAPAGTRRGTISNSSLVGLEYNYLLEDRENLEPMGINPIIPRRNGGFELFGNKTGYQRVNSPLNSLHVRDLLITVESGIEQILTNYLFEFNDAQTRLEIKAIVDGYLERVQAAGGITNFETQMDENNNTEGVISQNAGIIDIEITPVTVFEKLISRVTVLGAGQVNTGGFTTV